MAARKAQYQEIIMAPFGNLGIITENDKLLEIEYLAKRKPKIVSHDPIARKIADELQNYFDNANFSFTVLAQRQGTEFQQRVWRALQRIPVGKAISYGTLAKRLNTSPRAIGNACRANPIPIVVPCHRVVAQRGVGGYMGARKGQRLAMKQWLLLHEQAQC